MHICAHSLHENRYKTQTSTAYRSSRIHILKHRSIYLVGDLKFVEDNAICNHHSQACSECIQRPTTSLYKRTKYLQLLSCFDNAHAHLDNYVKLRNYLSNQANKGGKNQLKFLKERYLFVLFYELTGKGN